MLSSKRLESFDLLRLFFVLLALISHFRVAQGAGYELPTSISQQAAQLSKLPYHITLTRSSMSALLIIFGFMIEYVYANTWRVKGAGVVLEKMLTRTIICYLAFVTLAFLAIYVHGGSTFKTFILTISFVYNEDGKAFLFKYYTFLIPVVFLLMWARFNYGLLTEVLLIVSLLILAEVVKAATTGFPSPFGPIGENFFGIGNKLGPSVIHSLLLVTFGGLAANYTSAKKLDGRTWLLIGMSLLSLATVGLEVHRIGFGQFVILMASTKTYRAHNSHVYFAFGILSFLCFWLLSWVIVRQLGIKIKEWISYYGGNTFIIFLYGNIILLFIPKINVATTVYPVTLVAFLLLSLACVNLYYWANDNLKVVKAYNRVIGLLVTKFLAFAFKLFHYKPEYTKA